MSSIRLIQRTGRIELKQRTGRIELVGDFFRYFQPETKEFINRVKSDGGEIGDLIHINNCITTAKNLNIYNEIGIWVDANFAVKKDTNGNTIKIYDISANSNEALQIEATNQPLFSADKEFNGRNVLNFDGDNDYFLYNEVDSLFVFAVLQADNTRGLRYIVNYGNEDAALRVAGDTYRKEATYDNATYQNGGYLSVNESTADLTATSPHIVYAEPDSPHPLTTIGQGFNGYNRNWRGPIASICIGTKRLSDSNRAKIYQLMNNYYKAF